MLDSPDALLFAASLLSQLGFYLFWRLTLGAASEKVRAWGLTLQISTLYSLLGLYWVARFNTALLSGTALQLLAEETLFDRACVVHMMSYLVCDLCIGLADYRPQLRVDTTYVHHVAYFLLEAYVLFSGRAYCRYYLIFAVLEVPTAVMALGACFPALRADLLFGASFFATRIAYEVYLMAALVYVAAPMPLYLIGPPFVASMAMHVQWFRLWLQPKKGRKE